jgi:hypothetical protein
LCQEMIRENTNISTTKKERERERLGYCEFKKHKPWFNKECSKFVNQRKQAKLQCLQDPNEINI